MSELVKPIILDETGVRMANALEAIAIASDATIETVTYAQIKNLVNAGLAPKAYPVGTLIHVAHETGITCAVHGSGLTAAAVDEDTFLHATGHAGTAVYEYLFDGHVWKHGEAEVSLAVLGISYTGAPIEGDAIIVSETAEDYPFIVTESTADYLEMILQYGFNGRPFDGVEAIMKVGETPLAAGTYYFEAPAAWSSNISAGDKIEFTLTQTVPAGGHLVIPASMADNTPDKWKLTTFSDPLTTSQIESVVMSKNPDTAGTKLGDLNIRGDSVNGLNSCQRSAYGSNHWGESNIRQWLNSDKPAGQWFEPQTDWDRLSSTYNTLPGFQHGVDPSFLAVIGTVENINAYNTIMNADGNTSGSYTTKDKFYLLSMTEFGRGNNNGVAEGHVKPYFEDMSQLEQRVFDITNHATARNRWLRSCLPSASSLARGLRYVTGVLHSSNAVYGYCAAPACRIIREAV